MWEGEGALSEYGAGVALNAPNFMHASCQRKRQVPTFHCLFQVGISATGGGHYFPKHDKDGVSWVTEGREYMLSVEDPKDSTNDIGR